ncbi:copper fist DNA binding domain-containing protein, partial [Mycena galopus ATCC 62051]
VFINDKKFSWQACIKGHRASTCSHSDRPLFEVPRKGRPRSQCEKCRGLRQARRYHSKCLC